MGKGSGVEVRGSMMQGALFAPDGGAMSDDEGRPSWVTDETLAAMLANHKPHQRAKGAAGGTKNQYSPTQLEKYMRCPYGWFIEYISEIKVPRGHRTHAGSSAHRLIEAADRDGIEAAKAMFDTDPKIPDEDREWIWGMVERAWESYSKEWPEGERHQEEQLRMHLPSGHEIAGRADRVDVFDDGVLVIDWKLNCTTKLTTPAYRQTQTQRYLYPLMAAQTYERPPLGMIYVSLQQGEHEGSAVRDLGIGGAMSLGWQEEAGEAIERVEKALTGIERGDWWRKGKKCPSWCSCHVEDTAREKWSAA